jgi:hypothetical protein
MQDELPRVLYHDGPLRSANLEPFTEHSHKRGSGHLGTGLYVYLSADAVNWRTDNADVVNVIVASWKKPFVLHKTSPGEDELPDDWDYQHFYAVCEELAVLANTGTVTDYSEFQSLRDVVKHCEPAWRKGLKRAYDLDRLTE